MVKNMDKISFKLEVFEGPLELMLHLISKHKLDIYDIEISKLLEQYLCYLDQCKKFDLEIAGEFIEMAAKLIYIKTLSLLPSPEEAELEKKELQGVLIEYSLCQIVSKKLAKNYCGDEIFVKNQEKIKFKTEYKIKHDISELLEAYKRINLTLKETNDDKQDKFKIIVKHKMYSVTTKIIHILRRIYKSGYMYMDSLYEDVTDRSERVATFLAVLELSKSGRIFINEDNSEIKFIDEKAV